MKIVVPPGIGDTTWCLLKMQSLLQGDVADLIQPGDSSNPICRRAVDYLMRFDFVRSVSVEDLPLHPPGEPQTDTQGRYNYMPSGWQSDGGAFWMMPNGHLERGNRIEEWLPELSINWDVMDHFSWGKTEYAEELRRQMKPYAVFYLGPESGNAGDGHNRGWLWDTNDWLALGQGMRQRGLTIAVVGANYDRSFYDNYMLPALKHAEMGWLDTIGTMHIAETLAFIRGAKVFVGYQSGLGVVAHYLGVPTVMWWRPDGNSIRSDVYCSFDERMATAWTRPDLEYQYGYMGLIYTRQTPTDILAEIDWRGWIE